MNHLLLILSLFILIGCSNPNTDNTGKDVIEERVAIPKTKS